MAASWQIKKNWGGGGCILQKISQKCPVAVHRMKPLYACFIYLFMDRSIPLCTLRFPVGFKYAALGGGGGGAVQ